MDEKTKQATKGYIVLGLLGCVIVFIVGWHTWGSNQEVQQYCRDQFAETHAEDYLDQLEFYMEKSESGLVYCCVDVEVSATTPAVSRTGVYVPRCKIIENEKKEVYNNFDSRNFNLTLGTN